MCTFDTFFLACYVHGFCTILGTKNHISLDIKIMRRSYKSILGKNLDFGIGNHLNPRGSSKCTVFMTSFFTKVFFVCRGNAEFQVLFGDVMKRIIAKQRTHLQCTIETISVSIYETFNEEFQG